MPVVTKRELAEILTKTDKFFTVRFAKRTDNTVRKMNCRNGVTRHLVGGDKKYDPKSKDLLCTYSIQDQGYRSIPIEGLIAATVDGEVYVTK